MSRGSRQRSWPRRVAGWTAGWVLAAAFYLLLIDITDLPELIVGAGAAVLAATAFELSREQRIAGESLRARWLARLHRPLLRAGPDIVVVSWAALRALAGRRASRGQFRTAAFRGGGDAPPDTGRRALAEGLGSFAPNTIVVGVDRERDLILVHQLERRGGPETLDLLDLG